MVVTLALLHLDLHHLDLQADAGEPALGLASEGAPDMATTKHPNKDGVPALYHWSEKYMTSKAS